MRRIVLLSSAIVFVDTLFYALLTPLLPHYAHHYGLSKAGVGILAAAYPAGVLVGSIPSGWVAGRIGVKATAIGGLLIVAATSVVFGFGGSIVLLDLARLVQGVGSAFAWTASLTWLVAVSAPGRRGALLGQTISVAIVGALFGPALGGIASLIGTGPTFTAVAALALVVAVFALRSEAPAQGPTQPVRRLVSALRDRPLRIGLWLIALPALLFGTTIVLVPLHFSRLGAGAGTIGVVFVVAAALEATVSPLSGRLADRRGRYPALSISLAASAVGAAVLPWPDAVALLAVVAVLASAAFGLSWAPAFALIADAAEAIGLELAWAFALMNMAWAPGQALGSAAGGALAKATSDAVPYLILSGLCAATLVALRRSA
ncbi:MAG TPA: MFS transporter [Gaiellaceae bacterium]|nr:MFS transporter [Gaiellaceae bacterium]